ncbi:MAG TPA: hypothetical protein VGQ85_09090 [Candidatus Limnocylindrales bacterium]|nr:hypothetical protein [Candidatus Limnocylindrales bacterium]
MAVPFSATRFRALLLAVSFALAACATGGGAPSGASPGPPTLPAAPVLSPEDAAARAIATDKRFAGAAELVPGVIGASKWWRATPIADGGYSIAITLGSGDCPAVCISRHTWTFTVAADGSVMKTGESDDPGPTNQ